ncbi:hypothetical protein BSL78_22301 [Apostichopus japonicus]|uniref:Uncharacterized protein n=1 Tax=Stichopus japonicus TaxID=307972 RepID=A0A2G8JYL5_STIJA|nr:hypothetical protein BSL78_22301 [Apostichopus japonicus]
MVFVQEPEENKRRNDGEFLNEYEKKVKELKKEGVTLPEVVLAMQLIDGAGLDKKEKQIVLTAVDYSKKEEMYDQMKQALRKFFGDQAMSSREKVNEPLMKEESAHSTEVESEEAAYYTRGRNPYRGSNYAGYRGRVRYNRGAGRGNQSRRGSQTSKPTNSQPGESNRGGFQSYLEEETHMMLMGIT